VAPRSDDLEDKVLRSVVAAWQARLNAAYFDPEAKQRILEEIRESLAAQARDVPAHERAGLQDRVIARLLGTASRDAAAPAPETAPPADNIEERIIGSYPYPVARPYSALTEKERPMEAFGCLMDTFESLVHFLATVAVSAYLRSGLNVAECNRHLLEKFLKGPWSTGDLYGLLRDTVRLAGDCAGFLPYPELPAYLFTPRGKPTASNQVLGAFVTLRNRAWAHATGRDEAFYADILPANLDRLHRELAQAAWLANWELVRPVQFDEAGRVARADVLRGNWRKRGRPYDLAVREEDREDRGGPVRAEKSLLLVAPDRSRYLPLFPLSLFHFQLSAQGVYFLQRLEWQPARDTHKLRRAGYVAYDSDLRDHEESPGDLAARLLEEHIRRLEAGAAVPVAPQGQEEHEAGPPPDPDHELAEVPHEQAFHLRTFAGRERLLESLGRWIEERPEGGYLLLLGPPGQGKSALMAALARRESERQGCLLHTIKAHRNPLKFLPSLISQAAKLARTRFGPDAYQGDIDDLRNSFVHALEAVAERKGRAVVALDALDELALSDSRIDFLPPVPPVGVRVVLTCRPDIPLVRALRNRLPGMQEWDLPPLSEDDLLPIVERRLGAAPGPDLKTLLDWKALYRRLQGNPLFLTRALDRIAQALVVARTAGTPPRIDVEALPATLDGLFQDIYDEIAEREGTRFRTTEGRQKAQLLQLLCLAREPLGLEALHGLLASAEISVSLEDCRDRVLEMSQYLLDTGGDRFKPWHQGLADHVCGRVLGEAGYRQAEAVYCAWLRRPNARASPYRLRHHVQHLLAAERFDELCDLLTDLPFLEARAAAGQVFDLAPEFTHAVRRLPPEHPRRPTLRLLGEALQTDVHFLARHPTALFQCLWNSCWWYDCPEAAAHYDPPPKGWPPEGPPWQQPGPGLSALLESWRAAKERAEPGFLWLRSLRPPPVHLGTAQLAVFSGHDGVISSVACSPDGSLIASGGYDRVVRLWETGTGNLRTCLTGHTDTVTAVAFAPDGRLLASASADGTVRLWDVEAGREVRCLRGHEQDVLCVAFAPGGERVASGSWDKTARIWGVADGTQQACFPAPNNTVRSVAFSPDGRRLAAASGQEVSIRDVANGRELGRLRDPGGMVWSVAFSPEGRRIATGTTDLTVRVWDASTGAEVICFRGPSPVDLDPTFWATFSGVQAVAWSPDGRSLACGFCDGLVRVWDTVGGNLVAELSGHTNRVTAVAYMADGRHLVSASRDGTVRVWNTAGDRAFVPLRGHTRPVEEVRFAAQGQRLLTLGLDVTLRLWDVRTGSHLSALHGDSDLHALGGHSDVKSLTERIESPDGWRLIFEASPQADRWGNFLVWDLHRGGTSVLPWGAGLRFARGGRWVVTDAGRGESLRVWDLEIGEEVACFRLGSGWWDWEIVAITPDGQRIVTVHAGAQGDVCQVWDVEGRRELSRLGGTPGKVEKYEFSPDGRLVLGMADVWEKPYVWDAARGGEPLRLPAPRPTVSAVFSPDGRGVLTHCGSHTVCLWDAQTGQKRIHLPGLVRVWSAGFSEDGRRFLAVASDSPTIQVWDPAEGKLLSSFRNYPALMHSVEFTLDARCVVSIDYDQTLRVWDAETGRELASRHEAGLDERSVKLLPDGNDIEFRAEEGPRRVWDFRTGLCRAAEPWEAIAANAETRVVAADARAEVAWFPAMLYHLASHPDGRTWAGAVGNHVYLFTLERGSTSAPADSCGPVSRDGS
jgi:WD40 repeat protein